MSNCLMELQLLLRSRKHIKNEHKKSRQYLKYPTITDVIQLQKRLRHYKKDTTITEKILLKQTGLLNNLFLFEIPHKGSLYYIKKDSSFIKKFPLL